MDFREIFGKYSSRTFLSMLIRSARGPAPECIKILGKEEGTESFTPNMSIIRGRPAYDCLVLNRGVYERQWSTHT